MILYSKKVTAREAFSKLVDRVRRQVNEIYRMEKNQKTYRSQDIHTNNGELQQNLFHHYCIKYTSNQSIFFSLEGQYMK